MGASFCCRWGRLLDKGMYPIDLPQQCLVLVIMLMTDDIIRKKSFAFFGPLFGHSGSNYSFIAMVSFHGAAQSSLF